MKCSPNDECRTRFSLPRDFSCGRRLFVLFGPGMKRRFGGSTFV